MLVQIIQLQELLQVKDFIQVFEPSRVDYLLV
jgi:hypothetical protein